MVAGPSEGAALASVLVSSAALSWRGIEVVETRLGGSELRVPARDCHTVVMNLGRPFDLTRVGERPRRGRMTTGSLKIVPAAERSSWCWTPGIVPDMLHLRLSAAFVQGIADETMPRPDGVEIVDALGVRDLRIEQIGLALLAEARTGDGGSRLCAEALAVALAVHLLRDHSSRRQHQPREAASPGLPARTLRELMGYVDDHLEHDLTLAELAGVAHVSPYHFARLFKRSTGLSPHQYVIRRRVERARLLLGASDLALHEIAAQCGFADQSHLARQVRRVLGVCPSALRA